MTPIHIDEAITQHPDPNGQPVTYTAGDPVRTALMHVKNGEIVTDSDIALAKVDEPLSDYDNCMVMQDPDDIGIQCDVCAVELRYSQVTWEIDWDFPDEVPHGAQFPHADGCAWVAASRKVAAMNESKKENENGMG